MRDEFIPFFRIVKSRVFIFSTTNFQNILHTRQPAGHWGYSNKSDLYLPSDNLSFGESERQKIYEMINRNMKEVEES